MPTKNAKKTACIWNFIKAVHFTVWLKQLLKFQIFRNFYEQVNIF